MSLKTKVFKIIICLSVLLTFSFKAYTQTTPSENPEAWNLILEEHFVGARLDESRWVRCHWWDIGDGCTIITNDELEWYRPDNVSVKNGKLSLTAKEEFFAASNGRDYDYTSGMVTSFKNVYDDSQNPRFTFTYGYIEMRGKLPTGDGFWPAFWLLPTTQEPLPEIDILELKGSDPSRMYHNYQYSINGERRQAGPFNWRNNTPFTDWHVFAVDWSEDGIIWYVDGKERFRVDDSSITPHIPMYMILNLAVGGNWGGPVSESTVFPGTFEIDYVKVWQRK